MIQDLKYKSYFEIEDERPHIELGFKFKDYFETSCYYLISEKNQYKSLEELKFTLIKENKEIGELKLKNYDIENFINNFLKLTEDYDFNKIVNKNYKADIKKDLNSFFDQFKESILENKLTLEGEIRRMRKVAGII